MARPRTTREDWESIGRAAILDLLEHKHAAPWAEVVSRISERGWNDFQPVQPLQLSGARQRLREEGLIEEDTSSHHPPVTFLRLPYSPGRKRLVQREAGRRRKSYRKYLSWAGNQALCGKHAERITLDSMVQATGPGGFWVPEQTVGEIHSIGDTPIQRGPLDAYAHMLTSDSVGPVKTDAYLAVEVKNIHKWIYGWAPELWELLVKAGELAVAGVPVMPVLVCMRIPWQTAQLAKDIGFLACQLNRQLFSTAIAQTEFDAVVDDFALSIERHDGPHPNAVAFFSRTLRYAPPPSEPRNENVAWYRRQVGRFGVIAPIILEHNALASTLPEDARGRVFRRFRTRAKTNLQWPSAGGW
jgi:hypothetical protein